MTPHPTPLSRAVGALVGLAVGDALGTTVEFKPPGTFIPITDMIGGGMFRLQPGQWTDDTSMALCLAESLLACHGHDARHQMTLYARWANDGHWSSTGRCFDIGFTVRTALSAFEHDEPEPWGPDDEYDAGNGSLMRLAPVPIFWHRDAAKAIAMAAESSRTTHGAPAAVDACRYAAGLIVGAINGVDKDTLLSPSYAPVDRLWSHAPLAAEITDIANGSFRTKMPPAIRGTGYVVDSLEAALWAFAHTHTFETGALAAVNLGDDADTTGAIYGQIAGAYYGIDAIPITWRERIARGSEIADIATRLFNGD
jgi:ADP-ribosylglycohydrolase